MNAIIPKPPPTNKMHFPGRLQKYAPLHRYDCSDVDGGEFYLIWDETVDKYYMDAADLRINRITLGQVKPYDHLKSNRDKFGQVAASAKVPDYYWAYESNKDGVVFSDFIEKRFDSERLSEIAENVESITVKANEKHGDVMSSIGEAAPRDISDSYRKYWTYSPELTEEEVVDIISDIGQLDVE